MDHVVELLGAQVLQQVPVGPEADGVEHMVVSLGHGEHDDLDGRQLLADEPDRFNPVHHRHLDVHQHKVELLRFQRRNGFLAALEVQTRNALIHALGLIPHVSICLEGAGVNTEGLIS